MRSKSGQKLLEVLRIIAKDVVTVNDIKSRTGYSFSEVRKLLEKGKSLNYIESVERVGGFKKCPGKHLHNRLGPSKGNGSLSKGGRPEHYFYITSQGRSLMRFDPELKDKWAQIKEQYLQIDDPSMLDVIFESKDELRYRIGASATLREFEGFDVEDALFGGGSFYLSALKRFLYVPERLDKRAIVCYDELVKVIGETSNPELLIQYCQAIEVSLQRLSKATEKHKLLLEKMRQMPELKEYFKKDKHRG